MWLTGASSGYGIVTILVDAITVVGNDGLHPLALVVLMAGYLVPILLRLVLAFWLIRSAERGVLPKSDVAKLLKYLLLRGTIKREDG